MSSSVPEEVAGALPSDRFGKFVRTRKLGAGGMGEVWRAWDTELDRWVALKFLKGGDDEEIARFKREAQLAGKLAHPNIAAIYEIGERDGQHFIAMQFVDGQTLRTLPRGDRKLLVRLARDAALALRSAHETGIVHRDIKPENLMVTPGGHLYVMDFGLARAAEGAPNLSVSGMVVGTPSYMPPEQARGEKADARADVYSTGATLYELLTDRPPFHGANVLETLRRLLDEEPKPPRQIDPGIDADLETIVLKCLEKDRARRYATAGVLAQDLDRWLAGEPVLARPITAVERWVRRVKRHRLASSLIAALVVAIGIGLGALLVQGRRAGAREEALNQLSELWGRTVDRKRELRKLDVPADRARRELAAAAAVVDQFVAEHPAMPQGWYLKARASLYLDDPHRAEAAARRSVDLSPEFAPGWTVLGMALLDQAQRLAVGPKDSESDRIERHGRLVGDAAEAFRRGRGTDFGKWGLPRTREEEVIVRVARALELAYVERRPREGQRDMEQAAEERKAEEYALCRAHLATSLTERLVWLDRAVEWAPGYAFALFLRAIVRRESGDLPGAFSDYDRALDLCPEFDWALHDRGVARLTHGDPSGALADFDRAIALRKNFGEAYFNRSKARKELGDFVGSVEDLDQALAMRPDDTQAVFNRGGTRAAQAKALAAAGRRQESADARRAAIDDFTRAIELKSTFVEAYVNRGIERDLGGDHDAAIADYDAALALREDDVLALFNRGIARRGRGDLAGALADFDRVLAIRETFPEAYYQRAWVRELQDDLPAANRDYTRAIELRADFAEAYNNRGANRKVLGDRAGALADYDAAIRIRPGYADAYVNRGSARDEARDYAGAIADYDRAAELVPGNPVVYYNRPNARLGQGDPAGAIADYDRAIERRRDYAEAYANRGNARQGLREYARAVEDYETALRVAPPDWPHRRMVQELLDGARRKAGGR